LNHKRHIKAVIIVLLIVSILSSCNFISVKDNNIHPPEEDEHIELNVEDKEEQIEQEPPRSLNISVVGDIMLHGPQIRSAKQSDGSYDFKPVFSEVKSYLEGSDLTLANFETTISTPEKGYSGYPMFKTPESILEALKYAGFDVLTTANNHCLDNFIFGLENTLNKFDEYGFLHTGTSRSPEEQDKVLIVDKNGIKVAILAYTYGANGMEGSVDQSKLQYMVNFIDEEKISNDIQKAKAEGADVIIACMHWGVEYVRQPNDEQKALADKLFADGVDIIFGSHPHVIQPMERRRITTNEGKEKDGFIIYSLGNFVSNQRDRYQDSGVIINLEVIKDGDNISIGKIGYTPTWVRKYTDNGNIKYEILPVAKFMDGQLKGNENERIKSVWNETTGLIGIEDFEPVK
jgi:poly-gamma-glutamate capsule biosynthesis protein CapA/YwtB (metallophosphatase superfamily)